MSKHLQGLLSVVTKAGSELNSLIKDVSDTKIVAYFLDIYKVKVNNFSDAYEHEKLALPSDDVAGREKLEEWFDEKMEAINCFMESVEKWISEKSMLTSAENIESHDSVSNVSSQNSKSSAKLKAKKAELEVMAKFREELRQLEEEERRIKQKREDMELNVEMKKVDAMVCAYKKETLENEEEKESSSRPNTGRVIKEESVTEYGDILRQQNEITKLLAKGQERLLLPKKEPESFDGKDPTKYKPFIQSFERLIESRCDDDADRLYFLEQFTRDRPRDIVRSCIHMDVNKGYKTARKLLQEKYGNEFNIANAFLEKIENWPQIQNEDAVALDDFATFLVTCANYMENISVLNQLNSPKEIQRVVHKLPFKLRERWRTYVDSVLEENNVIKFLDLSNFVNKQARILNRPIFGNISDQRKPIKTGTSTNHQAPQRKSLILATGAKSVNQEATACTFCKLRNHKLPGCRNFNKLSNSEKIKFIKDHSLCFGCLNGGHRSTFCRNRARCDTCGKSHPTCMHVDYKTQKSSEAKGSETSQPPQQTILNATTSQTAEEAHINSCSYKKEKDNNMNDSDQDRRRIAIATIPVKVRVKGTQSCVTTYAILDNCSSDCFISTDLLNELNVFGEYKEINLTTLESKNCKISTRVINDMEILDLEENETVEVPVMYSRKELPLTKQDIPTKEEIDKWPHLRNVPFSYVEADVGLLLGVNVIEAVKPLEVVESIEGPYATRHKLGWSLNGPLNGIRDLNVVVNHIKLDIEAKLEYMYNKDFLDIKSTGRGPSIEDTKWQKIVEEGTRLQADGHYEIPLPFREEKHEMPNNFYQAKQRMESLKRKFHANPAFFKEYSNFMDQTLMNDFMERVPENEIEEKDGKAWYLVHHATYHKVKRKIRVVFNCSLKFKGVSLNDKLLQGPDLTSNSTGVLLRFRYGDIAIVGDIEKMYYQVKVPKLQRDFLRLLWYPNNNLDEEPVPYRLKVHVFGAVSSPSCANFALKQCILDQAVNTQESTTNRLLKNFYVDDMIVSVDEEEEAISFVKEAMDVCSSGGFNLTQMISNSEQVINFIPENRLAKEIKERDLDQSNPSFQRVLGVVWNLREDCFEYRLHLEEQPPTRRGVLSFIFSIYDPLGFIGPCLLPTKALFQDLCRLKCDWDETISDEHQRIWNSWLQDLPQLEEFKVNRCFKPREFKDAKCQLHIFGDGSEVGYGAVAYLRWKNTDGDIFCSILMAKSRLAPLKKITIPRIELSAAQLVVVLRNFLVKELDFKFDEEHFWTDSEIVLKYIGNDKERFQRFVANRVAFIREHTEPSQWHFVQSSKNPADHASRGMPIPKFVKCKEWKHGPDFLWEEQAKWPLSPTCKLDECDVEVKQNKTMKVSVTCSTVVDAESDPMNRLIESSSSWENLKRKVAWILKVKEYLMSKRSGNKSLGLDDFQKAEIEILAYVQKKSFSSEIELLRNGKNVTKKSALRKLFPILDQHGLLRVGGRLENSNRAYSVKHPMIIPKLSNVSELLARHAHLQVGHLGREATLTQLRQTFWIIGANALVRRLVKNCVPCRKREGKPGEQVMANLPKERVIGDNPPFSNCGIDYFGPFYVSRGRSSEKRYGVVFTCLETRAAHIEVANSLDVDSFMNALRRFIARRGQVKVLWSDNGTNLTAGEKELRVAIKKWNQHHIAQGLAQRNIEWNFNPPTGSHFGGIWERQIRTIRKLLSALTNEQPMRFNDDQLNTLMCEIESILNGRPLTALSEDPNDLEPLTPNNILLLKSGPTFPPGLFDKKDSYTRRRWRQVQYLANLFWNRWKREYLSLLQKRQKWTQVHKSPSVGDLVCIMDLNLPRNCWPLGRVVELISSQDSRVRSVKLKTAKGELIRPIHKLIWLLSP